jgi:hypothetical protein
MKRLIILLMCIVFIYSVSSQTIKVSDLTPTGIHSVCVYNIEGKLNGCYNDTIQFNNIDYPESNHTYYIKLVPNIYDMGFSGSNIISYLTSLIPFIIIIGIGALIIGLILAIVFFVILVRR